MTTNTVFMAIQRKAFHVFSCAGFVLVLFLSVPADGGIAPVSPEEFFVSPETEVSIHFNAGDGAEREVIDWKIRDYWEETRSEGEASPDSGGGFAVDVSLPRGYYEIVFPEEDRSFGILALEPYAGERDPFFAIDAALSWLVEEEIREPMIRILARAGIASVRERIDWRGINPSRGEWDWELPGNVRGGYDSVRKLYGKYDMEVLDSFHSVPPWAEAAEGRRVYPDDLLGTREAWMQIAERWSPVWAGLDVWNEPDVGFGGYLPADQYLPLLKAIRHGMAEAGIETLLGGGVLALQNRHFMETAARNQLLEHSDYLSFHFYGDPLHMEYLITSYREWMADFGREKTPLWLTETGDAWQREEERPTLEQGTVRARNYVFGAVEGKACGIARNFAFVYPDFSSGGPRNVGMTDKWGTPHRSLAAYFHMAAILSGKPYVGDIQLDRNGPVARARVFDFDADRLLVVVAAERVGDETAVKLPFTPEGARGTDGRTLEVEGNSVLLDDGLVYVMADRDRIENKLDTDTRAAALSRISRQSPNTLPEPGPIVLEPRIDEDRHPSNQIGYHLPRETEMALMPVRVYNFSGKAKRVNLEVLLGDDKGSVFERRDLTVPANEYEETIFKIPEYVLRADDGVAPVTVRAVNGANRHRDVIAVNWILPWSNEEHLERFEAVFALPVHEEKRWSQGWTSEEVEEVESWINDAGHFEMEARYNVPRHAIAQFVFELPNTEELERADAIVVRLRHERPATVRLRVWTDFNTSHFARNRLIRSDGQWATMVFPLDVETFYTFEDLGPEQVDRIYSGLGVPERLSFMMSHLGSPGEMNGFEIDGIWLVGNGGD